MPVTLTPQTQLYTMFDPKTPLYKLAATYPKNMCWLTVLFYVAQFLGFENNKKLHKKLSNLLYVSIDLMHIGEGDGALYFPKKYQLSDRHIRFYLNKVFKDIGFKVKVEKILSDITYNEINVMRAALAESKQLLTIIKNIDLRNPNADVTLEVPNHVILIKEIEDTQDGRVRVVFIDPAYGEYLQAHIGVHAFVQWIQYVWVLEKKKGLF